MTIKKSTRRPKKNVRSARRKQAQLDRDGKLSVPKAEVKRYRRKAAKRAEKES